MRAVLRHHERLMVRADMNITATCPICALPPAGPTHVCPDCAAILHRDCWEYQGGCGRYGCGVKTRKVMVEAIWHLPDEAPATACIESRHEVVDLAMRFGLIISLIAAITLVVDASSRYIPKSNAIHRAIRPLKTLHGSAAISAGFSRATVKLETDGSRWPRIYAVNVTPPQPVGFGTVLDGFTIYRLGSPETLATTATVEYVAEY